jgi:hypothetical protein
MNAKRERKENDFQVADGHVRTKIKEDPGL